LHEIPESLTILQMVAGLTSRLGLNWWRSAAPADDGG